MAKRSKTKENETMRSKAMGSDTMGNRRIMKSARLHTRGFTLIASLLMLLLLSGIAIGLMMMVNTEGKVGGTDLQNDVAFHSAEGGIETMYSNLAAVFQNSMAPKASQICAVGLPTTNGPTMAGVTWVDYSVAPASGCTGTLAPNWGLIGSGPNQGLYAQIIPVNMLVTAALMGGQEVSMTRTAQVALIPVFQFGVFSESDLSFFSGPNFDMVGPVHTNGDLYPFVGPGSTLVFHNKVSAYGNVVRTQLANGWNANTNYNGTVWMPTTANGCTALSGAGNCIAMDAPNASSYGDGSVQGAGGNPPQSAYNGANAWNNFSENKTVYNLINGNYGIQTPAAQVGTGAKNLKMPFVSGTTLPYQIIRRPPAGEDPLSALAESREYNMAQIRVLLTDDPAELTGGASDVNNVRLANVTPNQYGIATSVPATGLPALGSGSSYVTYFAAASNAFPDETPCGGTNCPAASTDVALVSDWTYAPKTPAAAYQTLVPLGVAPIISGTSATGPLAMNLCPPAGVAAGNIPAGCPAGTPPSPYYAVGTTAAGFTEVTSNATAMNATTASWNLIDGYLRVEYKDAGGAWHPVTNEWLALGFARDTTPPTLPGSSAPAAGTNDINPNAILLLQEPADRQGNGVPDKVGIPPSCTGWNTGHTICTAWKNPLPPEVQPDTTSTSPWFGVTSSSTTTQSISMYNWYPINFYDAREGEVRDNQVANNSCATNGVMNAVEIDVGNLKRWLAGSIGTSGSSVDYAVQNGYVLYFSDRRGMLPNPNAPPPNAPGTKSGDSGLEDVINAASAAGTPDGALEPPVTKSPEDVNQNGVLDNFGAYNLGLGFYGTVANATRNLNTQIISPAVPDPFGTAAGARIRSCSTIARKNWVSGARHALRLVDGSLGNLPLSPTGTLADPGGFSVASENPVYILGPYNSNPNDTTWTTGVDIAGHSSTAVIADAVTLLSSQWNDLTSMGIGGDGTVTNPGNRSTGTDYYRVAIAGGKNINFPQPTWPGVYQDFGTDGGVHNFLRYLENWNGTLNYKGSIVSLYYSTYATGVYKCCTTVYNPPTRNYIFDLDFRNPAGLPPGTPMFRDVESLSYRQLFTTRTATN